MGYAQFSKGLSLGGAGGAPALVGTPAPASRLWGSLTSASGPAATPEQVRGLKEVLGGPPLVRAPSRSPREGRGPEAFLEAAPARHAGPSEA